MAKQPVCCARLSSRLVMEKAALGRLAHKAAASEQRARPIRNLSEKIAELRTSIAETEQAIVDHEADHAGGRI